MPFFKSANGPERGLNIQKKSMQLHLKSLPIVILQWLPAI